MFSRISGSHGTVNMVRGSCNMKTKIENHVKDKLCEIEEVSNVANSAEFQMNPIRGNSYLNIV